MITVRALVLGQVVDVTQLAPSDIDLEDIADTLSRINRFAGRTPGCPAGYSVAQHAVLVSYLTSRRHAYEGLHHDDTEAYVGDVVSTFKTAEQRALEQLVRGRLAPVLHLEAEEPPAVKDADARALRLEQSIVQRRGDVRIAEMPLGQLGHLRDALELLRPMHPRRARDAFLARHDELTNGGAA